MKARIIALIMLVMLGASFVMYNILPFMVFTKSSTNIKYNKEESLITANFDSIKILQITDLHINGKLDMPTTFWIIKQLVKRTTPDLIIVTGDIFSSGCDEADVERFIGFMEDISLPYAPILGNHDDETPYTMAELSAILENAPNSLFKTGNVDNMYGNYYYNVKFSNDNLYQLVFMDSRSDGFTEQSKEFYVNTVNESKAAGIRNMLFCHIPLPQTKEAYEAYQKDGSIGSGGINEEICDQDTDVGFFETLLDINSTDAIVYGHDHVNNLKVKYNGIDLCYGLKTGPSAYSDSGMMGGTLITLNSDGTYTFEDIFVL